MPEVQLLLKLQTNRVALQLNRISLVLIKYVYIVDCLPLVWFPIPQVLIGKLGASTRRAARSGATPHMQAQGRGPS